jgi:LmbE family N-acetylglucosaminyl deacetylase
LSGFYKTIVRLFKYIRRFFLRSFIKIIPSCNSISVFKAVVIAPHPDDETFACGGLIALCKAVDVQVSVIFLTKGEASHRHCCQISPDEVAFVRKELAVKSGKILGLGTKDMYWLGIPDGKIPHPGEPSFLKAAETLSKLFQKIKPSQIFSPHYLDCWPDHEAAAKLVNFVLTHYDRQYDLYYYPVWMWQELPIRSFMKLLKTRTIRINIRSVLNLKQLAIECYLSETNPQCGKTFIGDLPRDFVRSFQFNHEVFFKPDHPGTIKE